MASAVSTQTTAQDSEAANLHPQENPYEIYQLRAPCERASAIVPHRLMKQPEVSWTRSKYRRIPEAKRPRNHPRSQQPLKSPHASDNFPRRSASHSNIQNKHHVCADMSSSLHNHNHVPCSNGSVTALAESRAYGHDQIRINNDGQFRHQIASDPSQTSKSERDKLARADHQIQALPSFSSQSSVVASSNQTANLDPRLSLDYSCFDDDEPTSNDFRVATLGSADLSFRDNNYPRPFSMPSRVSQLDGFTSDEESTLSSVLEYPMPPSLRSSCRSSVDILASAPPPPSLSTVANQTRSLQSRNDPHSLKSSRPIPSRYRSTNESRPSNPLQPSNPMCSSRTPPDPVVIAETICAPAHPIDNDVCQPRHRAHSYSGSSSIASKKPATSIKTTDSDQSGSPPVENGHAFVPSLPVPELRILPMASDGTFTRSNDDGVLHTSPVTPRQSQDESNVLNSSRSIHRNPFSSATRSTQLSGSPQSVSVSDQVASFAPAPAPSLRKRPKTPPSSHSQIHYITRRRASAASDARKFSMTQQDSTPHSDAVVLASPFARPGNRVHVPVSDIAVREGTIPSTRPSSPNKTSSCLRPRRHPILPSLTSSPQSKRKGRRNGASSSSCSVQSGISTSYDEAANVAHARTWSGYQHVPIQHQRQSADRSKSRSGLLSRVRSSWAKLTHRGLL